MHNAYIGIGTNIEPRSQRIHHAIVSLEQFGTIDRKSSIYETAPFGITDQPDFLNAVLLLNTELELGELHTALRNLEKKLGRTQRPRWHEREIDFDILFYDDVIIDSEILTVPHSELHHRSFVLVPLYEIEPDLLHPVLRKSISSLLQELSFEKNSVHLFNE
ncbi:MAG: 2-amino-4-hydroxy-6-hydroxymethyldihydropteridine diphosphokinase [Candidatus Kapaibacterium sp.]